MTCYDPQGNVISGGPAPAWYPCNFTTSDGFGPCCQPDLGACLPNLACAYSDDVLIRGGCTDFTFRSKNCPQFLLESDPAGFGNFIHNCQNGTGCYNANIAHSDHDCSCAPDSPNLLLIYSNSIVYAATERTSTTIAPAPAPAPISTSTSASASAPAPAPISTSTSTSAPTVTPTSIPTAIHTSSTPVSQVTSSEVINKSPSASAPILISSGTATTEATSTPTSSNISSAVATQLIPEVSPSSLVITGSATSTATTSPQTDGSNLGLKIGLPVGIVGGIALLLLVLAAIFWRRGFGRRRRDPIINSEPGLFISDSSYPPKYS